MALAAEGCKWAQALGASELVVWSAFDGYDYNFQVRLQLPGEVTAYRWEGVHGKGCTGFRFNRSR